MTYVYTHVNLENNIFRTSFRSLGTTHGLLYQCTVAITGLIVLNTTGTFQLECTQ